MKSNGEDGKRRMAHGSWWRTGKGFFCGLIAAFMMLFFSNCYEAQEGCLDLGATNYDVTADDNCPDCCTYPSLNLAFRHLIVPTTMPDTSVSLRYNSYYPTFDSPLDTFTIERIRYFLSEIRLVRPNGEEVHILDSVTVEIDGNEVTFEDSFAKVDRDIVQTVNVGTVRTEGEFSAIRFFVGLAPNLLNIDPSSVPRTSQLNVSSDTLLYMDTINIGYLSSLVVFNRDTVSTIDSTRVAIFENTDLVEIPFAETFTLDPGFDIKVTLNVDYLKWFHDIGVPTIDQNMVNDDLRSQFVENIVTSFSISTVE
ncbi:MAG: hypothetical protein ACI9XO_000028 [Paraglaciecola sp.]|jgi:hypothetical protein